MDNNFKGIEFVWLTETDLTNLNAGEGGTNIVDVKKFKKANIEYPYVSGQAMRFYLREAIRRALPENKFMCTPNDRGESCGNVKNCLNCDLFGYMLPKKAVGAAVRVSPIKVSPAIGLLPLDENSTIDFLTRKKRVDVGDKAKGDIVNVELGINIYKGGISIDLIRIGYEEKVKEQNKELIFEDILNDEEDRKFRIKAAVSALKYLADYSKQARLLTDFTPDIILASLQKRYSHRLQKAFELDENCCLNIERFKAIVNDLLEYSEIYFGIIPGLIKNESDVIDAAKSTNLEILKPNEVYSKILERL